MSEVHLPPNGEERLTFRNYAKAHRHGTVIGQLPGGQSIPFGPYSLTQVGLFVGGVVTLYLTREVWMRFGATFDILMLIGVPFGLAMAERFVRPEGRSPLRSVVSLVGYALAPRAGRRHGRARPAVSRPTPCPPRRIFIRDLDVPAHAAPSTATASRTSNAGPAAVWWPEEAQVAAPPASLVDLLPPAGPTRGKR
ncbi:hypothetical protein E0F15_20600 [Frankia sp. B2]|uniref:hypothetical protein n=1 Tax=Frankia sp. B2 TaxID=2541730 RepID=UPI00106C5E97|nr:hypothetical protein [Frankia sp. B2]TFE25059.1 hypothetical protein E0F15_20600 [Frankia sp. B2]